MVTLKIIEIIKHDFLRYLVCMEGRKTFCNSVPSNVVLNLCNGFFLRTQDICAPTLAGPCRKLLQNK